MKFGRSPVIVATGAVASILLGGCSGGDNPGSNSSLISIISDPTAYPTFDETAAQSYKSNPEFTRIGAWNYAAQNIHYAHTATLSNGQKVKGAGTLIAVFDDGFLTSHQELSGKTIHSFLGGTSSLPAENHGTAVAAIAAGKADGKGMMGVAPDAALHLTAWGSISGSNFLSHLTNATNDARSLGAAVQNNSWGWADEIAASQEMQNLQNSGAATYAEYLPTRLGYNESQWRSLFSAYDGFQKSGVIIFANSNDDTLGDVDAWSALPLFVPELQEAWIVAVNARLSVDGNGKITDADLRSAPCGSAAHFCLTADGTVYAPTAADNASYQNWTGTSFSAPQISGQIALLAQAFPNLSPEEWTTRLFVTAQTDWTGFRNSVSGSRTYGAGITKQYSSLYGHGVPDIKAALSPVGGLSIASGENVQTAQQTPIEDGVSISGPVVGNSVARALASRKIMVIDRLGTDFYITGSDLKNRHSASGVLQGANESMHLARAAENLAFGFVTSGAMAPLYETLQETAAAKLMFSQSFASMGTHTRFSNVLALSDTVFLQFFGQMADYGTSDTFNVGFSRLTQHESGITSEFTLSFANSFDRFFGSDTVGPFMEADQSMNFASGFSASLPLGGIWSLVGFAEIGSGFVSEAPYTLADYGPLAYASGGLMVHRQQLLAEHDRLSLYAGVRPTVIAGRADLRIPVSREMNGTIRYDSLEVNLAGGDVPLRAGLTYTNRIESDFDLTFNVNSDFSSAGFDDSRLSLSAHLRKQF
jgi:subtilisin family serine protease